jgi:UDP-GlcNAc3NAcA epimerase
MKIATVVGARPQFIKAAVLSRVLRRDCPAVREVLIHTGQHYDAEMSDVFFHELDIPKPDYHLAVGGGSHGQNTGRMLERVEQVLMAERPDCVLVYGDTDSTLAGILAGVKLHIRGAHVEAGLRSFNRRMPEEINRVLTDHASDLLFTPTDAATRNLSREGISGNHVCQAGDVMYDAALFYASAAERESRILETLGVPRQGYMLATIHRPQNTDDRDTMCSILEGFAASPRPIVWPVHPRARKQIQEFNLELPPTVLPIAPVGYLDMVQLERNAALIGTDSGGVQKEAFFHGVPCITLRDETEWVELVDSGWNRLVSPRDVRALAHVLQQPIGPGRSDIAPYGTGQAGEAIAAVLARS